MGQGVDTSNMMGQGVNTNNMVLREMPFKLFCLKHDELLLFLLANATELYMCHMQHGLWPFPFDELGKTLSENLVGMVFPRRRVGLRKRGRKCLFCLSPSG